MRSNAYFKWSRELREQAGNYTRGMLWNVRIKGEVSQYFSRSQPLECRLFRFREIDLGIKPGIAYYEDEIVSSEVEMSDPLWLNLQVEIR